MVRCDAERVDADGRLRPSRRIVSATRNRSETTNLLKSYRRAPETVCLSGPCPSLMGSARQPVIYSVWARGDSACFA
jgi:hypothetical protein